MSLCPRVTVADPELGCPVIYFWDQEFADEMPEGVVLESPPLAMSKGCLCGIDIIATAEVNGYNCQSLPGNRYTYTPKGASQCPPLRSLSAAITPISPTLPSLSS